jgi:ADP-heptose:LPS heptosyltransferase
MFGESAMPVPRLTPGADEKILAVLARIREDSGRMLAGIHIDAASERRVLPEELVLGTIERLDSLGITAILLGTNSDIARRIEKASGGRAHHLEFTLAGLKTALAGLDLFIGPDSGPLHAAAALGVPCVGVYGPNIPARSGPIAPNVRIVELPLPCRPCNQNRLCPREVACIAGIDPAMIVNSARDAMGLIS